MGCRNFPELSQTQFRDVIGEEHLGTASNEAACLKRAEDFHHWCGNQFRDGAQVAASHDASALCQVYHPAACEPGWAQWDAFCYKHFWEKKTWFEAERLCRERGAHLASIHSEEENRFVHALTLGLSVWIGYTDLNQDSHYEWSDSTQDDFSNLAKNCTDRAVELDCSPAERAQQWYDWQGHDEGHFVCKRNALLPMGLLRNATAKALVQKRWEELLPVLAMDRTRQPDCSWTVSANAPELKTSKWPLASSEKGANPYSREPKILFVPGGSMM